MTGSILSFLYSVLIFVQSLHPLHVSVTEIEYDEKDRALEMMMRVFIDDLELTLKNKYQNPNLDILNPKERTVDQMMGDYFKEHFAIKLDDKPMSHAYLGHEREGEVFIFYIEISKVKKFSSIYVLNNVIMETYDDQSNLIHVTVKGKVKSLRLTKSNQSGILSFQ